FEPLLPTYTKLWFVAFDESPFAFFVIVAVIMLLMAISVLLERILRDRTRQLWWSVLERKSIAAKPDGALTRLRHRRWYQWMLQFLKWRLAPNLLGAFMAFSVIYLGLVTVAQLYFALAERSTIFCQTGSRTAAPLVYSAGNPCNDTGVDLTAGEKFRMTFTVDRPVVAGAPADAPWTDDGIASPFAGRPSWRGLDHLPESLKAVAAAPFRRIVPARWLQPLYAVREKDPERKDADKLGDRVFVAKIPFSTRRTVTNADGKVSLEYAADITAPVSGRLFLFANDVGGQAAYANNRGTARVCIMFPKDGNPGKRKECLTPIHH
ncbi:MAG: hypothetical protein NTX28_01350, partial [Novosphingobium sp.]|nr:hypothetical protein [Novosphingobium sp.]